MTGPAPQLSSDPLDILHRHDAWATRVLLERCKGLSREQFHQRFQIGLGSLHDNLTHIVSVMRRWADRIAERPLRIPLQAFFPGMEADARDRTPDELLALLADAAEDLAAVIHSVRPGLAATISVKWPSPPPAPEGSFNTYTFTKGAALTHLFTHGEYHRAQCINMFRQLGVTSPAEIDVTAWQAQTEGPPARS